MGTRFAIVFSLSVVAGFAALPVSPSAQEAASAGSTRIGPSGLRLPRFVSLKSSQVNVRKGPSLDHPVAWQFKRLGLPVEVINEFENWRQVRDSDNSQGWVFHSLLSGRRTALVAPWTKDGGTIALHTRRSTSSTVVARLEPGVLGSVLGCDGDWCELSLDSVSGWIEQVKLWGVYQNEEIE